MMYTDLAKFAARQQQLQKDVAHMNEALRLLAARVESLEKLDETRTATAAFRVVSKRDDASAATSFARLLH